MIGAESKARLCALNDSALCLEILMAPEAQHRRPARRSSWVGLALLLGACATYQAFDSVSFVREKMAARLAADPSSGLLVENVEVPFELDADIRAFLGERLRPTRKQQDQVEEIVAFIFGTLDLEYALAPTRNAVQTFRDRKGNCLSFVNLFVGLARERRLNPFYVEVNDLQKWRYRDGTVVSQGHIVAGMYVDGDLRTFDFLPYRPKSYRNFEIIDDLRAAAHFYNNLGAEAMFDGDLAAAQELLERAVALEPTFDKAANNLGVALFRQGRVDEAIVRYRKGLLLQPENVALLTNLAGAFQRQGKAAEAAALLDRLDGLEETSPFFFVYRGEVALANGEEQAALELMAEALRRDSEVPEVHVGLAQVYLALGELKKARHHISRALRLDATHAEARRYAALLQSKEER